MNYFKTSQEQLQLLIFVLDYSHHHPTYFHPLVISWMKYWWINNFGNNFWVLNRGDDNLADIFMLFILTVVCIIHDSGKSQNISIQIKK